MVVNLDLNYLIFTQLLLNVSNVFFGSTQVNNEKNYSLKRNACSNASGPVKFALRKKKK